jgi:hypothetical protein
MLSWCFPEISISCVFSAQMTVGAQVMSIFIFTHCGGAAAATATKFSSVWCVGGGGNCRWWENNGDAAGICSCHYQLRACNYFKGVAINSLSRSANNVNTFCLHLSKCQRFSFDRGRTSLIFFLLHANSAIFPCGFFCLASRISSRFFPKIERTPIALVQNICVQRERTKRLYAKSSNSFSRSVGGGIKKDAKEKNVDITSSIFHSRVVTCIIHRKRFAQQKALLICPISFL